MTRAYVGIPTSFFYIYQLFSTKMKMWLSFYKEITYSAPSITNPSANSRSNLVLMKKSAIYSYTSYLKNDDLFFDIFSFQQQWWMYFLIFFDNLTVFRMQLFWRNFTLNYYAKFWFIQKMSNFLAFFGSNFEKFEGKLI